MEEVGIKALNIIVENLQKWIDMAPAYVQDLMARYVQFKTYWLWWWLIASILWIIIGFCIFVHWLKDDDGFSVTMWWFVVLGCLVFVFMQIYYLIKINYVPELYLIDDFIWCQSCK